MRRIVMLSLAIATFLASIAAEAGQNGKQSDADICKLIVGKWSVQRVLVKGASIKIDAKFRKDGAFAFTGQVDFNNEVTPVDKRGTWKVSGGVLELSGGPGEGSEKLTIIELRAGTLKVKDETDREAVWKRLKE